MLTHRYIARFVIDADTPLFIGSGEASLLKDALVQKDINGFPMINGTSLAGVLRHSFKSKPIIEKLFGASNADGGFGSLLKVSPAFMVMNDLKVSEGILENIDKELLYRYTNLPSRQHVRINHKGTSEDKGLFDNEVVFKGTRFVFEIELRGSAEQKNHWEEIVNAVKTPTFRIGSGTRNGYGSLKVISIFEKEFNLQKGDLEDYINFDPSFNSNLNFESVINKIENLELQTKYSLQLKPDSFFIFSEGFGDEEADNRPIEEYVVKYVNGTIEFEKQTVIPASSIKGAISHRTAFHFNKIMNQFADKGEGTIGIMNEAVVALFGKAGKDVSAQAGNVFINDFYYSENEVENNKVLNHVAIDRFTGGAMDGALFSEKVSNLLNGEFSFEMYVNNDAIKVEAYKKALEETLTDICKGVLPLGGMTTKGNGVFTGKLFRNNEEIFSYE